MEELSSTGKSEAPRQDAGRVDACVDARVDARVDLAAAAWAVEAFLTALGHPPQSDVQLAETGRLVASAFHDELLRGYRMDAAQLLAGAIATSSVDLVVVRAIDITCMCPHHLLPASGVLHIGYAPNGKLVGLGAIARLAECFSRRLILQETLCEAIADALVVHLGARGAGCIAELAPACLCARGTERAQARVLTMASAGAMRSDAGLRQEFLALAKVGELRP